MAESTTIARRVYVNGIVQGVGFRPFVYQLAGRYNLSGSVANTSSGVSIHIEGGQKSIEGFCRDLAGKCPSLAHITDISFHEDMVKNHKAFTINKSTASAAMNTLISPDVAVCDDCLHELFDPKDRRFHYPFINCTNCGPRYTIIDDIPYDREKTSMKHFKMCRSCRAEYDDPGNRRFHAQPNACAKCGPHVSLFDDQGNDTAATNPIEATAKLLKQGYIVAIKGLGGFHLAVDAENHTAVTALRKRKQREEKPFAIMSFDMDHIRQYAQLDREEEKLLTSHRRPIVLLKKRTPNTISSAVAPKNRYFGTMLPYTPLHYMLLSYGFVALVMTSGNMSEEPIAIDNSDALRRLSAIADYFLTHDRDIYLRSDDSIVKKIAGASRMIRRSRGYIPVPVPLARTVPPILACGAELKNTICLTKNDQAFLSQHIGDLQNLSAFDFFQLTVEHMKKILNINPQIIAFDLHPDYLSTRYAERQKDTENVQVQHHHAHIVSAMTENMLEAPVIGLAFDGTGFGTDGAIWGGEVLVTSLATFSRVAHLAYVPMPGSDAAVKEPWRMAVSYLNDAFGEGLWDLDLPILKDIDRQKLELVVQMISKKINSPFTSSLGRLFDGVAAILGVRNRVFFEGQAAMELEMIADETIEAAYDYDWQNKDTRQIFIEPIIIGIVKDLARGVSPAAISGKFHRTLVRLFTDVCQLVRKETGLNRVVLSGGVFQNAILLTGLIQKLKKNNFQVFSNATIPANDGGLCLGQAMVAAAVANV
jgi:hydrogenase maturation protein HypF